MTADFYGCMFCQRIFAQKVKDLFTKLFWLHACCTCLMVATFNCTTPPRELLPDEQVMHFPFSMAIKNNILLVSSGNSDQKYSNGRMVAVDTNAVSQALASEGPKNPIPWEQVVKANFLIPPDVGLISIGGNQVIFASRATNQLFAVQENPQFLSCNDPHLKIENCADASVLNLPENDPYSLAFIRNDSRADLFLASYLSSDRIDMIELDKTSKPHSLKILKQFSTQEWVEEILKGALAKETRVITKKIMVTHAEDPNQARAYFLLEKRFSKDFLDKKAERRSAFKLKILKENVGALVLSIKVSDLIGSGMPAANTMSLVNLEESFGISLVQDFYIEDNNVAVILGRSPEALFKINLAQKTLIETQTVCHGASSMAVSLENDRIFVPCFSDNRIISFNLSSLGLEAASGLHGRGPIFVAIDSNNRQIFVTYNIDGKLAVFDFDLKYLGHIFKGAADNQVGS